MQLQQNSGSSQSRSGGQKSEQIAGKSYRINEQIRSAQVRVIDHNSDMLGILSLEEGIKRAQDAGLDLVELSPNAEPPVCKITNFGKMRYELQKKAADARKKQKVVETKEIKMLQNYPQLNKKINEADLKGSNFVILNAGEQETLGYQYTIEQLTETQDSILVYPKLLAPKTASKAEKDIYYTPFTVLKINSKKPIGFK